MHNIVARVGGENHVYIYIYTSVIVDVMLNCELPRTTLTTFLAYTQKNTYFSARSLKG